VDIQIPGDGSEEVVDAVVEEQYSDDGNVTINGAVIDIAKTIDSNIPPVHTSSKLSYYPSSLLSIDSRLVLPSLNPSKQIRVHT
jgi:hypothetical protein